MDLRRLHVHIDRLTLEGKTRSEGRRIVEAMERHLTALANDRQPVRPGSGLAAHTDGVEVLGQKIATQVFGRIGGIRNV